MRYSKGELATLWVFVGGPPSVAGTAAAIALAESSGDPDAINHNTDGSTDYGLWQINSIHKQFNPKKLTGAANAPLNARAAVDLYNARGHTFGDWVTYNNGAYKQFLGGLPDASVGKVANTDVFENNVRSDLNSGVEGVIKGGVEGAVDAATAVPKFLGKLSVIFSGNFWLRVGMVLGGITLIVLALMYVGRQYLAPVTALKSDIKAAVV